MSALQLVFLAMTAGAAGADDWPQWRGPNRDGHSASTGLLKAWPKDGPAVAWKFDKCGAGYGSPAVAGGKVFLLGADDDKEGAKEFCVCIDLAKGGELWRVELGTADGKYLYQWGSGPRSTPTVDGSQVYVLGAKGDLLSLNVADGKKNWSKNLVKDFGGGVPQWGYSESILIDGDRLLCTPGGAKGAIACLDKKTGDVRWQSKELTDAAGYSSIVATTAGGTLQYITQTMASVCGVRADDGKLLWRKADLSYKIAVIPTPVIYNDYVFVTAGYGAGCELLKLSKDGTDGVKAEKIYTSKIITNHHGGVVRVGEHIYGHSDQDNQWVCLPFLTKNGDDAPNPAWTSKKQTKGAVTFADGMLFTYSERTGELIVAKADASDWTELARFGLPDKSKYPRRMGAIWAHPVIANGKLFLRDHEYLFCFDIAAKK